MLHRDASAHVTALRPRFLVLHGPNLSLLGEREPEIYGRMTLAELDRQLCEFAKTHNFDVDCEQYNAEGALIDALHRVRTSHHGVVLNPAGYGHTSITLLDALRAIALPVIEVHLSNVHRREQFRQHLVTAAGCVGVISGLGPLSYELALLYLSKQVAQKTGG